MSAGFAGKVAELERALALVESSLTGAERERARALVAALLEVHRAGLEDLRRLLGDAELGRAAGREPSVAWLLACHEINTAELERAIAVAQLKEAEGAVRRASSSAFVPVERLLRRQGEPAP
jgi:hypothetical protein